jgi:monoamine oxidase
MARTPLLRALARLAEEHQTAERLGIPPAELRGQRAEAAFDRGDFLKRAGIAGAGFAAVPASLGRSRRTTATTPRIAIVGGGIAGLNAALVLADKNVSATIYEAGSRIGGRMHSDTSGYFSNGQVSEYCGELIDTGHQTIRALAKRFNLATVDLLAAEPSGSTDTYYFLGADYPVAQADADFQQIAPTLKSQLKAAGYPTTYASSTAMGRQLDAMSVYEWIDNYVPGGHSSKFGRFLDAAYCEEYGAETKDQASLNLLYLLAYQTGHQFSIFGASDERFHISGGNERLPQAMASYLGGQNIELGWAMQSISTSPNGTTSMTFSTPEGKQTVIADHVILCMSFAVLRTLDTNGAGFDDRKKLAIKELGAGRNAKLNLQFANRYWNAHGSNGTLYTDIGIQNTWDVTRGQSGATGILVDYSGGKLADVAAGFASMPYSNADSNAQVKTYAKQVLAKLDTVLPGISRQWNKKASLSAPFLDPLLGCSYSYWGVGQYTAFSGYERVQQHNIHFAGEHCSTDFQGYMEGGAAEGARAANEVLAQT